MMTMTDFPLHGIAITSDFIVAMNVVAMNASQIMVVLKHFLPVVVLLIASWVLWKLKDI